MGINMLKLSACVITKNEEKNIAIWLHCMKKIVDEIIVVDTGSDDQTIMLAENAGAKVYRYSWQSDFAAAKNFALEKATGDWILFLDADEYFTNETIEEVPRYLRKIHDNKKIDALLCRLVNVDADDGNRIINTVQSLRIFRNNKMLRYQGKVHETLRRIGAPLQLAKMEAEVEIYHTGYSRRLIKKKLERNLEMLLEDIGKQGEKPWHYAYLADCYYGLEDYDKTIYYAAKAIAAKVIALGTESSIYRRLIDAMALSGKESGKIIEEIRAARNKFPQLPEFAWNEGEMLFQSGDYITAERCLLEALRLYNEQNKTEETGSFAGRVNLLYYRLGKLAVIKNEKEKALEYYLLSLQKYRYNEYVLKDFYRLLRRNDPINIISCFKSIYEATRRDIKFISQSLVEYPLDRVYLYYTQKLQKLYKEMDTDLLTGGLLAAGKYEAVVEKISQELRTAYAFMIASIVMHDEPARYQVLKILLPQAYQHVMDKCLNLSTEMLTEEENLIFNEVHKILSVGQKKKDGSGVGKIMTNEIAGGKCSIIIVVHNHLGHTKTCIESIRRSTLLGDYEILVVDNASTDSTATWLKEQKDVRTISCTQNHSFAKACNLGVQAANGEEVLIMHNDVVVTEGWLAGLRQALYSQETIGAVCPREFKEMPLTENIPSTKSLQVLRLSDFCMLIKREVIRKIGDFDEQFTFLYLEDVDFSLRMIKAGYRLLIANNVRVQHHSGVTLQEFPGQKAALENNLKRFKAKWGFDPQYSGTVRQEMLRFINVEKDNLTVLDIGCACGGNLMRIKEINPTAEVYGVELNAGAASIASCFGEVVNYDIEKLEEDAWNRKFDVILMGDILEHLYNPLNTLQRLRNFLEDDGVLIASIPNIMHISVLTELLQGRWTYQEAGILDKTHLRFFTKLEIQRLMDAVGLHVLGWSYTVVGNSQQYDDFKQQIMKIKGACQDTEQYDAYQWIVIAQNRAKADPINKKLQQEFSLWMRQVEENNFPEESGKQILQRVIDQKLTAEQLYDLVKEHTNDKIKAIIRIGALLYQNNEGNFALKFMLSAYKDHVDDEEIRYAFAFLLQLAGDTAEAKKVIAQAKRMTPELSDLLKELEEK